MGFLDGLFTKAERRENLPAPTGSSQMARATAGGGSRIDSWGLSSYSSLDWEKSREFYEKVYLIFRCVDAIAGRQSIIDIVLKNKRGQGDIIDDPAFDQLINVRPNDYELATMFKYRILSQLQLSPRGVFLEVERKGNQPVSLHMLSPAKVRPFRNEWERQNGLRENPERTNPRSLVDGYKIQGEDNIEYLLQPDQVLWLRLRPHPDDVFAQMTPLHGLGPIAETDYLARMFNMNYLRRDGRPNLLVAIKGQVDPDDSEEIKQHLMSGPMGAGIPLVLETDGGVDVQDMAAKPRDLQWAEALQGSKQDILLAFGTPESVLGNSSQRTFSNAESEYANWMETVVLQQLKTVALQFDELTTGREQDDIIPVPFTDDIEAAQGARIAKEARATNDFDKGVISMNDLRKSKGLPEIDDPAFRVHYLPGNLIAGGKQGDPDLVSKMPILNPQLAMQNAALQMGLLPPAMGQPLAAAAIGQQEPGQGELPRGSENAGEGDTGAGEDLGEDFANPEPLAIEASLPDDALTKALNLVNRITGKADDASPKVITLQNVRMRGTNSRE